MYPLCDGKAVESGEDGDGGDRVREPGAEEDILDDLQPMEGRSWNITYYHTALYQEAAGTSKEQAERSPGGAGFYRNILPPKLYTGYCGSMYGYHPFSMGFPVSQGSYKTMSPAICHPRGSIRQPQATLGSFHPNSMLMRDNGYSLHSSYYSPPSFLGPRLFSGPSYLPPLLPPRTVDPASEMEVSAEATPESQDSGICLTSQTSSQEPSN
uniref:Uncharacterized protein n=1 Tax=Callorhinchus milii TaxID=7868 RepID=A0A4W3ID35_CALMI